ncbi:DUF2514 domain-containing protein [Klebsiella oxytoca]|nr:DUF2514 family protein [Klebsiella oxytoca]EGT0045213.1 DUF2514 domain-containing protein [Klebsiella oxytoca]ELR9656877.1 DUF2514 domain-containing protein [Klebsiella oxytoca]MBZ7632796.1 DUF2514 domain-containing protein [Klebsiella oxytoca]WDQ08714.1 DUF2514 family protein [Klebsiella oxytoca]HEC2091437.1 DUF2514 domain-containing protein [Klebsiella oxytoca]
MDVKKGVVIGLIITGAFTAGALWKESEWEAKWFKRDAADATALAIAEHGNRLIEQGRLIARDEAVSDARDKERAARLNADLLSGNVQQLQQQAKKLATRLDAARETANLAATAGSKAETTPAGMLAYVLGEIAGEAEKLAGIADERYRAGLTCERIYSSLKNEK